MTGKFDMAMDHIRHITTGEDLEQPKLPERGRIPLYVTEAILHHHRRQPVCSYEVDGRGLGLFNAIMKSERNEQGTMDADNEPS